MGFQNRNEGKFFTIYNGKICIRVKEGTEGSIARTNKVGNTVHEVFYDSFTGLLTNIKTSESAYGKSWNFDFVDNSGEKYTLQLSYSNSFATQFLKILPNIDLSKEFTISPSSKIEDGKTKSSLFVNQDNKPLKHAYTKENPNGLPKLEKKMLKGQEVWDDTEMLLFLENMIQTDIIPKLSNVSQETPVSIDSFDTNPTEEAPF
jgi:hypothetical protein